MPGIASEILFEKNISFKTGLEFYKTYILSKQDEKT